jgi:hypothetical protein
LRLLSCEDVTKEKHLPGSPRRPHAPFPGPLLLRPLRALPRRLFFTALFFYVIFIAMPSARSDLFGSPIVLVSRRHHVWSSLLLRRRILYYLRSRLSEARSSTPSTACDSGCYSFGYDSGFFLCFQHQQQQNDDACSRTVLVSLPPMMMILILLLLVVLVRM